MNAGLFLLCGALAVAAAARPHTPGDPDRVQVDPPPGIARSEQTTGLDVPHFRSIAPHTNGWMLLNGAGATNQIFHLEASENLHDWQQIALLDLRTRDPRTGQALSTNSVFQYWDPGAVDLRSRYYRFFTTAVVATNDWKNQALFPDDAFAASASSDTLGGQIPWMKFAIVLEEPDRVYYQDCEKYLLHHDFATARLEPFRGMSRAAFDSVSLALQGQRVLLGTVLFPPDPYRREYGIQFAGRDPYPREMVRRYFELVRSAVAAEPDVVPFYFPAYEQTSAADVDAGYFQDHGIRVSSVNRWVRSDQVLAAGWALGRLIYIPAGEIPSAYADGRLHPNDILLTDGVPAEIPFVAGIISLAPATPSSHVAILASTYGIPLGCVMDPARQAAARALAGHEVVVQGTTRDGYGEIEVIDVEGVLSAALRGELLELKSAIVPRITPKAAYGAYSANADLLSPADIRSFGGKAANYGVLRRALPSNCPPAVAFSFDLWDAFMDQALPAGASLRSEISRRLAPYRYPPDVKALSQELAGIRQLITGLAQFSSEQRQRVLQALGSFDPRRNLRFRSSSNAEDSSSFTAAGLYDSFSGCLQDELDADSAGPCACDPTEAHERGVFRAIQKVYASFYNENAYLERLRRGLDETQLGMALLVHHSTPDNLELANGVATVSTRSAGFGERELTAVLVTQLGAVSVTNPEGNVKPEVLEATEFALAPREPSALVPLGGYVLNFPAEYEQLASMLFRIYRSYPDKPDDNSLILDFEYKKAVPGSLLLKQVRPLPQPKTTNVARYLLNEPTLYWVYQSESSDVLANHRLKCLLTLENGSVRLDASAVTNSIYTQARFEYRAGGEPAVSAGEMGGWPGAGHASTNDPRLGTVLRDWWVAGVGPEQRRFELTSIIPPLSPGDGLFLQQGAIRKWLTVTYGRAVPALDPEDMGTVRTSEQVQLVAAPGPSSLQAGDPETFMKGTVRFLVRYLSCTNAVGPPLGVDKNFWGTYPAALSPWLETEITGLTSDPIRLKSYWSQSARAGHKYRYAWYVFEPGLEPDLPERQRQELSAAHIQLIHVEREVWAGGEVKVTVLDEAGHFRKLTGI